MINQEILEDMVKCENIILKLKSLNTIKDMNTVYLNLHIRFPNNF